MGYEAKTQAQQSYRGQLVTRRLTRPHTQRNNHTKTKAEPNEEDPNKTQNTNKRRGPQSQKNLTDTIAPYPLILKHKV